MKRLLSIVLIIFFLLGCSKTVYYKTEVMPEFSVNPSSKILVFMPKAPTIEEQKLARYLRNSLKRFGISVIEKPPFDHALFFQIYDDSYTSTYSMPLTTPSTTYSSGSIGGTYYSGSSTTYNTTYVPVTETSKFKKISVRLYDGKKNADGRFEMLWSGFVGAYEDQYHKNPQALCDKLISLFGQEFQGHIHVNLNQKRKQIKK